MSRTITIESGQTLFDIVIQEYGALDAIALLIEDNPHIEEITSTELSGIEVSIRRIIPAIKITNKQIAESFKKSQLLPASLHPIIS